MGTSLARKYLGTVWTLIALGTLGGYIETVRADGTVEGKDWGFVAARPRTEENHQARQRCCSEKI